VNQSDSTTASSNLMFSRYTTRAFMSLRNGKPDRLFSLCYLFLIPSMGIAFSRDSGGPYDTNLTLARVPRQDYSSGLDSGLAAGRVSSLCDPRDLHHRCLGRRWHSAWSTGAGHQFNYVTRYQSLIVPCKTPWKWLGIGNLLVIMLILLDHRMISQPSTTSFPC